MTRLRVLWSRFCASIIATDPFDDVSWLDRADGVS